MFNNNNNDKDYKTYQGGFDGNANKSAQQDNASQWQSSTPKSVWAADEYGIPQKEEREDDYAPAYVDNTYSNNFGNSFANALSGLNEQQPASHNNPIPSKQEFPKHQSTEKPASSNEKKYLGTSSFGFVKSAHQQEQKPRPAQTGNYAFNKPVADRTNSQPDNKALSGDRHFNGERQSVQSPYTQPNQTQQNIRPQYSQPAQFGGYAQPEQEARPQHSQPAQFGGYAQPEQEARPQYSQPAQFGGYAQPEQEARPQYSQSAQFGGYAQPEQAARPQYSQSAQYGGYAQPAQEAQPRYTQAPDGYAGANAYDNYGAQNYAYSGAQDNYGVPQYGQLQGGNEYDFNANEAPQQIPLTKDEIKRQQKHDALLKKEQERQLKEQAKQDKLNQKEQAKQDKLNAKEQEKQQKLADKQAQLDEKERQKQELADLKQQKIKEAEEKKAADKQAKEQAKQDKLNAKEQAKQDKAQAKFEKQNQKEQAKQDKLDKKKQALADKEQAKLDKKNKKSKNAETNEADGFVDMTEYKEERKAIPEETDMLGGDFVNAVYGGAVAQTAVNASQDKTQASNDNSEQPFVPRFVSSDRQTVVVTLPEKENMTRKQRKIAKKASRFDEMDLRNYPMTVGKWIGTFIVLAIPLINLFACICWFFGVGNKSRTALIRSIVVMWLILTIILVAALGVGYYFLAQQAKAEVGAQTINEVLIYGVDKACDMLAGMIGEDKILPIRNAIVGALGGEEKQPSSGENTGGGAETAGIVS